MDWDATHVLSSDPVRLLFRVYSWQIPSITYGNAQSLPQNPAYDVAKRITGGGQVFHSPGDIVVALSGHRNTLFLPTPFKEKLAWFQDFLHRALSDAGLKTQASSAQNTTVDLAYCATYPNPFELNLGATKIVGVAGRSLKTRFIIQGIIHLNNGLLFFDQDPPAQPFLCPGVPDYSHHHTLTVGQALIDAWQQAFQSPKETPK